jgi:hypothetical protein
LRDVAADIQKIAQESEGLLEINALMENIASQTNLLSMSASGARSAFFIVSVVDFGERKSPRRWQGREMPF